MLSYEDDIITTQTRGFTNHPSLYGSLPPLIGMEVVVHSYLKETARILYGFFTLSSALSVDLTPSRFFPWRCRTLPHQLYRECVTLRLSKSFIEPCKVLENSKKSNEKSSRTPRLSRGISNTQILVHQVFEILRSLPTPPIT